jgi:hypothetical protein
MSGVSLGFEFRIYRASAVNITPTKTPQNLDLRLDDEASVALN